MSLRSECTKSIVSARSDRGVRHLAAARPPAPHGPQRCRLATAHRLTQLPLRRPTTFLQHSNSLIMPAKKTTGPSYLDLAKAAIVSLKERNGSSLQAVKKFVAAKKGKGYVNGVFLRALRFAVTGGKLVQVKGSYKLAAKAKAAPKKKAATKVQRLPPPGSPQLGLWRRAPQPQPPRRPRYGARTAGAEGWQTRFCAGTADAPN